MEGVAPIRPCPGGRYGARHGAVKNRCQGSRRPHPPTLRDARPAAGHCSSARASGCWARWAVRARRPAQAPPGSSPPRPSLRHSTPLVLPFSCPSLALVRERSAELFWPFPVYQLTNGHPPARSSSREPPSSRHIERAVRPPSHRSFVLVALSSFLLSVVSELGTRSARARHGLGTGACGVRVRICLTAARRQVARRRMVAAAHSGSQAIGGSQGQLAVKAMSRVTHLEGSRDPAPLQGGWSSRTPAHRDGARRARRRVEDAVGREQMRVQNPMH